MDTGRPDLGTPIGRHLVQYDPTLRYQRSRARIALPNLTVRALRSRGFGVICEGQPGDSANSGRRYSFTISMSTYLGLLLSLTVGLRLNIGVALAAAVGFPVIGLPILRRVFNIPPAVILGSMVLAWIALGIKFAQDNHPEKILITHALPFITFFVVVALYQAMYLASRVPLFLPAALALVVAPLLTQDPWQYVTEARWRLAWLIFPTYGPLLLLVLRRISGISLDKVFEKARESICGDVSGAIEAGRATLTGHCLTGEEWPDKDEVDTYLRRSFQDYTFQPATAEIQKRSGEVFLEKCRRDLVILLAGITLVTFILVYGIAVLTVPGPLAENWAGSSSVVAFVHIHTGFHGIIIGLPWWPYAGIAVVFSIIAGVGFLSYALTDEVYENALLEAIVGAKARGLLVVGAAYLKENPSTTVTDQATDSNQQPRPLNREARRARTIRNKSAQGLN